MRRVWVRGSRIGGPGGGSDSRWLAAGWVRLGKVQKRWVRCLVGAAAPCAAARCERARKNISSGATRLAQQADTLACFRSKVSGVGSREVPSEAQATRAKAHA
jgi:hypothetical protein